MADMRGCPPNGCPGCEDACKYGGPFAIVLDKDALCELKQQNAALQSRLTEMEAREAVYRKALERARQFIENGVELGFIRMPVLDSDPAHDTLPAIIAALTGNTATKDAGDNPAMTLNPEALEAAVLAYEASPCMDLEGPMEAAITAYLASLPSAHGELVEECLEAAEIEERSGGTKTTIATLRAAATALRQQKDGWRTIDSAPKDWKTPIWAWLPGGYQTSLVFYDNEWRQDIRLAEFFRPTHWRPLPEPPTGGSHG